MILPKEQYLQGTAKNLSELYDQLAEKPRLKLDDFDTSTTALVIVDMIKGFVKEGPLGAKRFDEANNAADHGIFKNVLRARV